MKTISVAVLFLLLWGPQLFAAELRFGTVVGKIDCHEVSGCPGFAALWTVAGGTPDPRKYTMIPTVVGALKKDGSFELRAPVGEYYLGAQLRMSPGAELGPPRAGDLIFGLGEKPYRVQVQPEHLQDAGLLVKSYVFQGILTDSPTGVAGIVVDEAGKPVAGVLVFAFADPQAVNVPVGVSARTDERGTYYLPVSKPGDYYLRVRNHLRGGQLKPGDYTGTYGGTVPQPVRVSADGLLEDLTIQVRKLPSRLELKNAPETARPRIESN